MRPRWSPPVLTSRPASIEKKISAEVAAISLELSELNSAAPPPAAAMEVDDSVTTNTQDIFDNPAIMLADQQAAFMLSIQKAQVSEEAKAPLSVQAEAAHNALDTSVVDIISDSKRLKGADGHPLTKAEVLKNKAAAATKAKAKP